MLDNPAAARDDDVAPPVGERPDGDNVSVFIMTHDEEVNIERCLASVAWSDDVVVLDSFSRDRTLELATAFPNVRIYQRSFGDYATQRNHGLHDIAYRNRWVLVLDADEAVGAALAAEIRDAVRREPDTDVFLVRREVFMNGRRLRRNLTSGFWIGRLLRPEAVRYEGRVHERLSFVCPPRRLAGRLEHHPFDKGIGNWLERRRRYARLEAEMRRDGERKPTPLRALFDADPLQRRAALKEIYRKIPANYLVYYLYNLLVKFPFADGRLGMRYLFLEAYSQFLCDAEYRSMKRA